MVTVWIFMDPRNYTRLRTLARREGGAGQDAIFPPAQKRFGIYKVILAPADPRGSDARASLVLTRGGGWLVVQCAPQMKADACRFCRLYAIWVVAFAALAGAVTAVQMAFGLQKFAGEEYVAGALALSAVRSLAPGVTGSALLLVFVLWAHPLSLQQLRADLPRLLRRALLITLPGYLVAAAVVIGTGLLLSRGVLGVGRSSSRPALGTVSLLDWGVGSAGALVDAGLIALLAWRYLPRLQAGRSSLPMKLVLAWTFGTGLRMTAGLLLSLLVPD